MVGEPMIYGTQQQTERPGEYWASLPAAELAVQMGRKIDRFTSVADSYHLWTRWKRSTRLTYGYDPDNDGLTWAPVLSGKRGELVRALLNYVLRFKRAHHALVINQRPAPQARPAAFDSSATEAVPVGNAVLDRATGKLGGEQQMQLANWYCQDYGAGWVSVLWDELLGEEAPAVDAEGVALNDEAGARVMTREGDVVIRAHRPDCVVFDVGLDETGTHQWLILATQRNRYELAKEISGRIEKAKAADPARAEEDTERFREHILRAGSTTTLDKKRVDVFRARFGDDWTQDPDVVWTYELFHLQTSVVPNGRYAMLLDGQIIAEGANPYSELPIYEHAAMHIQGTKFGYTHMFDLLGPAQIANSHISAATSTAENLGIPGIWLPMGTDAGATVEVVGGLRLVKSIAAPSAIEWSGDAPRKLTESHAYMVNAIKELSGVTDAAMGQASGNSGKQDALAYSASLSNASDFAASYIQMVERAFNGVLKRYRAFARTERVVQIAGRGRRWQAKTFTSKTLRGVDNVDVQLAPAIMRSSAGVVQTADTLLEREMLSRDEYMGMITTGRLEPGFDGPQQHEALIERENEMILEGEVPEVAPTDNPIAHIARHRTNLDNPEARRDEKVVMAQMQHLEAHDRVWLETSIGRPTLLMALNIPLHPMAQQQMQPPPGAMPGQPADAQPQGAQPNPGGEGQPPVAVPGGGAPAPTGEELPELPEAPTEVVG
jgi:hypothetical protein